MTKTGSGDSHNRSELTCPFCGDDITDSPSEDLHAGENRLDCGSCGRRLIVVMDIDISYTVKQEGETVEPTRIAENVRCCTGINGSHAHDCQSAAAAADLLTCWCCGGLFPSGWAGIWSKHGVRCLVCGEHPEACRTMVGERLQPTRVNTQGLPV